MTPQHKLYTIIPWHKYFHSMPNHISFRGGDSIFVTLYYKKLNAIMYYFLQWPFCTEHDISAHYMDVLKLIIHAKSFTKPNPCVCPLPHWNKIWFHKSESVINIQSTCRLPPSCKICQGTSYSPSTLLHTTC